jgi:hypothetical protein
MGAGSVTPPAGLRAPLTAREDWFSDGRQALRFRPNHWKRDYHRLEITAGEVLPDQEIPLLKSRREQSRAEALKLWEEDQCGLDALQSPVVAATITQTITPQTRLR